MNSTENPFSHFFDESAFLKFAYNPEDTQAVLNLYTGFKKDEATETERSKKVIEICQNDENFMGLYKENYLPELPTLEELDQCPENSFGKAFARHLIDNKIQYNFKGLDTSMFMNGKNPLIGFFTVRGIRTHDMFHVVTGLGTSKEDEYHLFAVQLAQFASSYHLASLAAGFVHMSLKHPHELYDFLDRWVHYFKMGKEANFLPGFPFENHFETPLSEVREMLNIKTSES